MPTPYFQFKQFTVWHDRCAMKVGTDGVLLGVLTPINPQIRSILDVGTGSGLVALMLAQRCSKAQLNAIDIDRGAYEQAVINFTDSPWTDRLTAFHQSLEEYAKGKNGYYDLIVSNPPYFSNSLKGTNQARTIARHTDSLTLDELFCFSEQLLNKTGSIVVILPVSDQENCVKCAERYKLFCTVSTAVIPKPGAIAKRVVMVFNREPAPCKVNELMLEKEIRGIYTPEFTALVRDFYLKL